MIVIFCGHRNASLSLEEEQNLVVVLRSTLKEHPDTVFYLGDYGAFDGRCNAILRDIQREYPKLKRIFVTPYLLPEYGHLKYARYKDKARLTLPVCFLER